MRLHFTKKRCVSILLEWDSHYTPEFYSQIPQHCN